ncbi:MAG TPA: MMPL family transporter [Gemmatimonadaceae bacterium]|nr:MMPL family transporter [Gemmatimonadaceae bacterium]
MTARYLIAAGIALALFPFQRRIDASISAAHTVAGTESGEVEERLNMEFHSPFTRPALLVATGLAHAADSDSGRADMRAIVAPLQSTQAVIAVLSPGSSLDTMLVGTDKTTAVAVVGLAAIPGAMDSVRAITRARLAEFRRVHPRLVLRWTGEPALVGDLRTMGMREARRAELIALPVTVIAAFVAFGSIPATMAATLAAALVILISLGLTGIVSTFVPATTFTRTLIALVGTALTIDYMLLMVRRSREGAPIDALRRTVLAAGGIVGLGFLGLTIAPTGELRAAAAAGAITAVVAAVTVILLAPRHVSADLAGRKPSQRWMSWGAYVVSDPWIPLCASLIPLTILAGAARDAKLVTPLERLLPATMESADAYNDLKHAGRAGAAASLRVLLTLPGSERILTDSGWSTLEHATRSLASEPGVASARSLKTLGNGNLIAAEQLLPQVARDTYVSADGRTAVIDLVPDLARGEASAIALVSRVRALDAEHVSGVRGATLRVSGLPAYALDYQDAIVRMLPRIVLAISLATLIALVIVFRAPVIAIKAVALNLIVALASIGGTVLVFQKLLGFGSIFPTVPALAFGAAFGTSMDYELFLLGGVMEARRAGSQDDEAIVLGVAHTGALITRAAGIMACLFLAFTASRLLPLAMLGFCLALAVTLDATLVRLALAPALLKIAGRWNWWPSR